MGRTINKARNNSADMMNDKCASFCFEKGFSFFGTEWYDECYCGNKLAAGGVEARESDCSTPCKGDKNQACGGSNRLTLYKRPYTTQVNPGWRDFKSIGCYV